MPLIVEPEVKTIRKFRIEIDSEYVSCDFGRDIPREKGLELIRTILGTFDPIKETPNA